MIKAVSKHVVQVEAESSIFMGSDGCDSHTTASVLEGMMLISPQAWSFEPNTYKEISNYFMTKKLTTQSTCALGAQIKALNLLDDVPVLDTDYSNLYEVKLRLTNAFGRPIIAESVSATIMPVNGKKKEVIDFKLDKVWVADATFPIKKKGDYSVTYSIKLDGGVEITTTESYTSSTSVSVSLRKFEGGKATFGL